MTRMLVFATALLLTTATFGAVYKWTDNKGTVHYSDQLQPGAAEVKTVPIQTYKPSPVRSRSTASTGDSGKSAAYATLAFVSPANDATIRDNQGNVAIQLTIAPPLRSGHSIALSIDGTRQGQTVTTTTFTLSNVARGTHTLLASVVDAQGTELKTSAPLTLHMVRQSELFKPQNPDQPREGPIQPVPRAPQAPRFTPDPGKSRF